MDTHFSRRVFAAGVIISIGAVTGTAHLIQLFADQQPAASLLGVWIPFGLSMLLVGAGAWLYWSSFSDSGTVRIAAWTCGGVVVGVGFGYPIVPYQAAYGISIPNLPYLITNWMTVGAAGGFAIGFYDGRQAQSRARLKQEQAELATRERELERQNERLDQFASMISHDLRNPLNVATMRVEVAQENTESEHLDTAMTALDRMENLIEDVLILARQGEQVDDTESVQLSEIATQCWTVVDTTGATMQIEEDLTFKADPSRLQQLLENLFRNSIEHSSPERETRTDGGSGDRNNDVTISLGSLNEQSGFYVADDGPGIPEDERDDVFDSGYSTADSGTGLGLAIVQEIIIAHDWEITVTESAAGGARFEISEITTAD